jgi:hypothetical protein
MTTITHEGITVDQPAGLEAQYRWVLANRHWLSKSSQDFLAGLQVSISRFGWTSGRERVIVDMFNRAWQAFEAAATALGGKPVATTPKPDVNVLPIFKLFELSRTKLKRPAITMKLPGMDTAIRISIAKETSRYAGQIFVNPANRDSAWARSRHSYGYGRRYDWLARIEPDGSLYLQKDAPAELIEGLVALAADPIKRMIEYGQRTGYCCFCNLKLEDPKSTAVGFGWRCSQNWGLTKEWKSAIDLVSTEEAIALKVKHADKPSKVTTPRERVSIGKGGVMEWN